MEFTLTEYKFWIARNKIRGKPGKYFFLPKTSSSGERIIEIQRKSTRETIRGSPIYYDYDCHEVAVVCGPLYTALLNQTLQLHQALRCR